jgi:hypothetical protein
MTIRPRSSVQEPSSRRLLIKLLRRTLSSMIAALALLQTLQSLGSRLTTLAMLWSLERGGSKRVAMNKSAITSTAFLNLTSRALAQEVCTTPARRELSKSLRCIQVSSSRRRGITQRWGRRQSLKRESLMKTTRELLLLLAQMHSTLGTPRVSKLMMLTNITLLLNSGSRCSALARTQRLGQPRLILAG